jgi:hypothetical protein
MSGTMPSFEMAVAHFIVSADVERSVRFYTEVLGGRALVSGQPSYVALANPDGHLIEVGQTTLPGGWRGRLGG